jgi:hypothetical protein
VVCQVTEQAKGNLPNQKSGFCDGNMGTIHTYIRYSCIRNTQTKKGESKHEY